MLLYFNSHVICPNAPAALERCIFTMILNLKSCHRASIKYTH